MIRPESADPITVPKKGVLDRIHANVHHLVPERVEIEERSPHDFMFHPRRFDLMAKYIYAKYRVLGVQSQWARQLYLDHIAIIAPGYEERDGSGKTGPDAFVRSFDGLLDSIQREGFDPERTLISVDELGMVVEGAHRLAACAAFNKKVTVAYVDHNPRHDYRAAYFLNNGLRYQQADAMALEYCKLNKNSYVALVWPRAVGRDEEIRTILETFGTVYYEKKVRLYKYGPCNLIKLVYDGEPWLGDWYNSYEGAVKAVSKYFEGAGAVRVFVFEAPHLADVIEAKKRIRSMFGIGNYSVHINDSHRQTLMMGQALLNDNSIHFLNHAVPKEPVNYLKLMTVFRQIVDANGIDPDFLCVDSGSVMAAYGVRDVRDLDLLHHGYDELFARHEVMQDHNDEVHYHAKQLDDILFNPQNHFYVREIKFASLDTVKQMKLKRDEHKDRVDVRSIDSFLRMGITAYVIRTRATAVRTRIWGVIVEYKSYLHKILPPSVLSALRGIRSFLQRVQ